MQSQPNRMLTVEESNDIGTRRYKMTVQSQKTNDMRKHVHASHFSISTPEYKDNWQTTANSDYYEKHTEKNKQFRPKCYTGAVLPHNGKGMYTTVTKGDFKSPGPEAQYPKAASKQITICRSNDIGTRSVKSSLGPKGTYCYVFCK